MAKIKVLRIITRMNIGGPARQAALLSSELSKKDFDCILLTGALSKSEGDMTYAAEESGVTPLVIPEIGREISLFGDLAGFFKIYGIIRKERPEIVHTHTAKAGAIGRLAARMAGVPVVIHTFHGHVFHSYFSPAKTNFFLAVERILAALTDKIITISGKQKDEIKRYLKIGNSGKLALIPLGFDLRRFLVDKDESALRAALDIPKDALVLGIVGRLTAVKDHKAFLKAAREIKARNSARAVRFLVVGDGELRDDLAKLAADLGLQRDVIFTGWRKDIDALYRIMDVAALTSLNEGTPVSLIEALASARPAVAVDVGGVRDVIENGKSGFVVASGDVSGFAGAVTELFNDKHKREKFGIYGREYICRKHSKERLINAITDLYYSELARKKINIAAS